MWANNSETGFVHHPASDYGAAEDVPENQEIIAQQRLRSKILSLCIKNSLATDDKLKIRAFNT